MQEYGDRNYGDSALNYARRFIGAAAVRGNPVVEDRNPEAAAVDIRAGTVGLRAS
jgi:hypothetical protein